MNGTLFKVLVYSEKPLFILAISHIHMLTTPGYQGYCWETYPAVPLQTGRRVSSHLAMAYLFRRHKAPAGSRQGCRTYQNERYLKYILTHLNLRVIEVPAVSRVTNSYITYFAAVHGLHPSFIS
jgi:hypothetical protein